MSVFPRAQRIAALVAVTLVVIVTLVAVSIQGSSSDTAVDAGPTPNPRATPTPVPILDQPRVAWESAREDLVGAADTSSPVPCPFVDERERESNNFLSLTPGLTFVLTNGRFMYGWHCLQ